MIEEKLKEKKHNYFYKITNSINGKYYYGIRSTDNDVCYDDKYMGSGIAVKKAMTKYGLENFIKEIIADYPTRKEASEHERLVVTEELIQMEECYNSRTGGDNEFKIMWSSESLEAFRKLMKEKMEGKTFEDRHGKEKAKEIKKKMSETQKTNLLTDINRRNRLGNAARGGTFITQEWIKKRKELRKLQIITPESRKKAIETRKNNGKIWHSEEARRKMSENSPLKGKKMDSEYCVRMSKIAKKLPCLIEGMYFESVKRASEYFGVAYVTVFRRIGYSGEKWKNWNYFTKED